MLVGSCICFHDALTFNGTGYRGAEFIDGFSYWPDFFARVFLGYLLYDLVIMLVFRRASCYQKCSEGVHSEPSFLVFCSLWHRLSLRKG